MNNYIKKFSGFFLLTSIFLTQVELNECYAKTKSTYSHNVTKKNNTSAHYVIIYKDVNGRQQTYNTYAKSKNEAKHNLYNSRQVSKVLNITKK